MIYLMYLLNEEALKQGSGDRTSLIHGRKLKDTKMVLELKKNRQKDKQLSTKHYTETKRLRSNMKLKGKCLYMNEGLILQQ